VTPKKKYPGGGGVQVRGRNSIGRRGELVAERREFETATPTELWEGSKKKYKGLCRKHSTIERKILNFKNLVLREHRYTSRGRNS